MSGVILLIPSRGRPRDAQEAADSAYDNARRSDTWVTIIADQDDPKFEEYLALEVDDVFVPRVTGRRGIVDPLNQAALAVINDRDEHNLQPEYVGFMGDDHRVRTPAWDDAVMNCWQGIVYGDDLFQGENLPTAVFMRASWIKALGYMAPNDLQHLYVDNFWRDLGQGAQSIKYLPDMVIEHMHPDIRDDRGKPKGAYDELKRQLNDRVFYNVERERYEAYMQHGMLAADIRKVRS